MVKASYTIMLRNAQHKILKDMIKTKEKDFVIETEPKKVKDLLKMKTIEPVKAAPPAKPAHEEDLLVISHILLEEKDF